MIVVDASVAIKWIVNEPKSSEARAFLPKLEDGVATIVHHLIAPALLCLEVHNVIAGKYARGQATPDQMYAVDSVLNCHVGILPVDAALVATARRISFNARHRLAVHSGLTPPEAIKPFNIYDCIYVAFAVRERAKLLTADAQLAAVANAGGIESILI